MKTAYIYESLRLAIVDLAILLASLWISMIGVGFVSPDAAIWGHVSTLFLPLCMGSMGVYLIAGLYDKHVRFSRRDTPRKILMSGISIAGIALVYAFILQRMVSECTPVVYAMIGLIVSFSTLGMVLWRVQIFPRLIRRNPVHVVYIASQKDVQRFESARAELEQGGIQMRIYTDIHAGIADITAAVSGVTSPATGTTKRPSAHMPVDIVVSNSRDMQYDAVQQTVYEHIRSGIIYMDMSDMYEQVFEMIPIESVDASWVLRYASIPKKYGYMVFKRMMDIAIALPLAVLSIVWYPIVYIAIKLEDRGPLFIVQNRVGERGKPVQIIKFRSMRVSDEGKWVTKNDNRITRVGKIIRKTRIDELPQLINVLQGGLSLIGPRPELPTLVELYKKEISHYDVRHMVKPGLSGWAQVHHDVPPHSVEETKVKVSYDLYYIKHKGILLDLKIAFATIKTLLSRTGI